MSVLPRDIYDLIIGFSGGYKEWKKTHPPLPYLNDIHRVNTDRSYLLDVYKVCISMNDLILLLPHRNSSYSEISLHWLAESPIIQCTNYHRCVACKMRYDDYPLNLMRALLFAIKFWRSGLFYVTRGIIPSFVRAEFKRYNTDLGTLGLLVHPLHPGYRAII